MTSSMFRFRSRALAIVVVPSLLALTACGGSDSVASSEPAGPGTADIGVVQTDDAATPAGGSIADLVVDEPAPSGDAGSCTVTSTGAIETSFTSGGGVFAVSSDYWLPAGVVSPLEPVALIVTCDAGDGTLLTIAKTSVDELPFEAGTVELQPLEIGLFTPEAIISSAVPETMQLDAFDAAHVAGSVTFEATDAAGGVSEVSVTFDLANPMAG